MTTGNILKYLRENPGIKPDVAARRLSVSCSIIKSVAEKYGIGLAEIQRSDVCANAPEACFDCPFADCINSYPCTKAETRFASAAYEGINHTGKTRKRRKHSDKPKNKGKHGAE